MREPNVLERAWEEYEAIHAEELSSLSEFEVRCHQSQWLQECCRELDVGVVFLFDDGRSEQRNYVDTWQLVRAMPFDYKLLRMRMLMSGLTPLREWDE